MNGRLIVETERLWLREHIPEDAEATFELGRNPLVQRYTGAPCLTSVEEARTVLLQRPIEDYRRLCPSIWPLNTHRRSQFRAQMLAAPAICHANGRTQA